MKVVVQRVNHASCIVDGKITGEIDRGFMLLVGFTHTDTINEVEKMAKKISSLRVFDDECGKMNKSLSDVNGKILSISQFTLYGDCIKGNRPSFTESMKGDLANPLYETFNDILRTKYNLTVETGVFGAHMILNPQCDGPVTIIVEY